MTVGQRNIWRAHVYNALREALSERRPFSKLPPDMFYWDIKNKVLRATFIAKIEGDEYSRLKR